MANEWQQLAVSVTDSLREAYTSDEALRLIDLALTKLRAQHGVLRSYRLGVADNYVEPDAAPIFPATHLEDARREIKRCSTLHGLATGLLRLCCAGLEIEPSVEMNGRCDHHSGDALRNADDAQERLRTGASFAKAAIDAIGMAGLFAADVPYHGAWLLTAEQLHYTAIAEVTQARNHVLEMQDALVALFFHAWSILLHP